MKKRLVKFAAVATSFTMILSVGNISMASSHTVVKGDTLWKLAKEYYNSGERYIDIFNANKNILKSPTLIYPGQILEIPEVEITSDEVEVVSPTVSKPVHIQGAIFGGEPSDNIAVEAVFDPAWITTSDNQVYNKNLANFSIIALADTYYRQKDEDAGVVNRVLVDGTSIENYEITSFMEQMGFTDVEFAETFRSESYEEHPNDSATFIMAYKNVDGKYDSFAFIFRGSYSNGEWRSSFDIGDTGDIHQGLEISSQRAMEIMTAYIESHDDKSRPNTALVAGHSRGGSIANIIGAAMEDNDDIRSYTYTFSALASVYNSSKEYKTIFNIADANDLFNEGIQFKNDTPKNYGTNIYVDIASSPEIQSEIAALKGRDDYASVSKEAKAEFNTLFKDCFTNRSEIYESKVITEYFETEEEASERVNELEGLISVEGMKLLDLIEINEPELSDEKYKVEIKYSDAALLEGCAVVFAYGKPAGDGFMSLFKGDSKACKIAEWIVNNGQLFTSGHRIINAYAITTME